MKTPHADTLWRGGVPLSEAPDYFAPARLMVPRPPLQQRGSRELTGGWKVLADQRGWDQEQRKTFKDNLDQSQAAFDNLQVTVALNCERQRYIASLILKDKAVATGFLEEATELEIIPPYLFGTDEFIKWGKNQIVGNGFHFISVKVAKLRRSEELSKETLKSVSRSTPNRGRPGFEGIADLIREKKSDPKFRKLPRKAQAQLIENAAREKFPRYFEHGKEISQATIYRYLKRGLDD